MSATCSDHRSQEIPSGTARKVTDRWMQAAVIVRKVIASAVIQAGAPWPGEAFVRRHYPVSDTS